MALLAVLHFQNVAGFRSADPAAGTTNAAFQTGSISAAVSLYLRHRLQQLQRPTPSDSPKNIAPVSDGDDFGSAQRHRDARGYGQERHDLHAVEIDGAETVDSLLAFGHRGKQHPRKDVSETVRRPGHPPCLGVVSEERRTEAVCKGEVGAPPGDRDHQGGDGEPRAEAEQLGGFTPGEGRAQGRRPAGDDRRREQRVPREKAAYQRPRDPLRQVCAAGPPPSAFNPAGPATAPRSIPAG